MRSQQTSRKFYLYKCGVRFLTGNCSFYYFSLLGHSLTGDPIQDFFIKTRHLMRKHCTHKSMMLSVM